MKLSDTSFLSEGVYYVDIYLKGTKVHSNGNEYPYYVEVSSSELSNIALLQQQRQEKANERKVLEQEVSELEVQVNSIKEQMGYDENQEALKSIAVERGELVKKLNEKIVEIKTMFGLSELKIEMKVK